MHNPIGMNWVSLCILAMVGLTTLAHWFSVGRVVRSVALLDRATFPPRELAYENRRNSRPADYYPEFVIKRNHGMNAVSDPYSTLAPVDARQQTAQFVNVPRHQELVKRLHETHEDQLAAALERQIHEATIVIASQQRAIEGLESEVSRVRHGTHNHKNQPSKPFDLKRLSRSSKPIMPLPLPRAATQYTPSTIGPRHQHVAGLATPPDWFASDDHVPISQAIRAADLWSNPVRIAGPTARVKATAAAAATHQHQARLDARRSATQPTPIAAVHAPQLQAAAAAIPPLSTAKAAARRAARLPTSVLAAAAAAADAAAGGHRLKGSAGLPDSWYAGGVVLTGAEWRARFGDSIRLANDMTARLAAKEEEEEGEEGEEAVYWDTEEGQNDYCPLCKPNGYKGLPKITPGDVYNYLPMTKDMAAHIMCDHDETCLKVVEEE